MANKVFKSMKSKHSELDIDARVCYYYFNVNSFDETIIFLTESINKYPENLFLYRLKTNICFQKTIQKQYNLCLSDINSALKRTTNDYELYLKKAFAITLIKHFKPNHVINAYLHFIEKSPKDDINFAKEYYAIAICYYNQSNTKDLGLIEDNIVS